MLYLFKTFSFYILCYHEMTSCTEINSRNIMIHKFAENWYTAQNIGPLKKISELTVLDMKSFKQINIPLLWSLSVMCRNFVSSIVLSFPLYSIKKVSCNFLSWESENDQISQNVSFLKINVILLIALLLVAVSLITSVVFCVGFIMRGYH